ncbi:MAG: sporulation transcriptional regulator SpoIIID [Christensenellales bacterium]
MYEYIEDSIKLRLVVERATSATDAKKFGISKSTVLGYGDVSYIDPNVAEQVREVLQKNKDERHIAAA